MILLFLCSAIAPLIEYAVYIIPIAFLVLSPFAYGMFTGWRIKHKEKLFRSTLLNPDKNGLYPVPTDQQYRELQQPVLELAHTFHSKRQPSVPQSLTYAPRTTSNAQLSEDGKEIATLPLTGIPSYRELPFKPGEILLGYEETNPFYVSRETMISTLVGGATGTGKSTLLRLILSQYLAQDCALSIIDPHYQAGKDSLGKSFDFCNNLFSPTAYEKNDVLATIKLYDSEIERRLKGSGETKPLILVADEFTGLLADEEIEDQLTKLILKISSQSRKVFIYAFCIAQQWHKDLVPSTLRNGFTNYISTKSRMEVAQQLTGNKLFAKEVEQINGFQCVYMSLFSSPNRLYVPNTTQKDIEELYKPSTRVISGNVSGNVSGNAVEELVIAHLKLGDGVNKIVREVYGVENKGPKYKEATTDIYRIISERIS